MATNKFATMLHKNSNKIIVILVYAILEWILILLLLLNSLFSFLIGKFVKHFGLKPPCTYCSTIHHLFESGNQTKSHQEHICEKHGTMISKQSYCSTHHKLTESKNLCFNCSFFTLESENNKEEETDKCCCCDEILLSKNVYPFQLPFKDSWDFLDYIQKKTSFLELIDEDNREENVLKHKLESEEKNKYENDLFENPLCNIDDESTLLENAEYMNSDRFICIELIDSVSASASISDRKSLSIRSEDIMEDDHEEAKGLWKEALEMEEMDKFTDSEREIKILSTKTEASNSEQDDCDQDVETTIIPHCSIADLHVTKCISIEVSEDHESNELSKQLEESRMDDPFIDMEIDDESLTIDHLKATLKAQNEALSALYTELEEERKASTISTNETMSMITKLQEEKSSMQMEALQYQRMMEEQAEYDQEALQLLNDLMIKREKEKQELEKELQVYREKVMEYEARDNMVTMRSKRGSFNSTTSSEIDPNCDLEEKETEFFNQMNIPDISLADFDEERLCILEELKALEAKLFTLPLDNSCSDMAKKLLPLFDAADNEFEEGEFDKGGETFNNNNNDEIELEKNEICIQDELGNMHERLQALEEDKEFLKHCMSSMMKGNKGLVLLQEILQHLRDLRSVELSYNKCITE